MRGPSADQRQLPVRGSTSIPPRSFVLVSGCVMSASSTPPLEIPLSDSSDSLPGRLDLGTPDATPPGRQGPSDAPSPGERTPQLDLPEEIPLTSDEETLGDGRGELAAEGDVRGELLLSGVDVVATGGATRAKRGRPNVAFRAALSRGAEILRQEGRQVEGPRPRRAQAEQPRRHFQRGVVGGGGGAGHAHDDAAAATRVEEKDMLVQWTVANGFHGVTPLHGVLLVAHHVSTSAGADVDNSTFRVCQDAFGMDGARLESKAGRSTRLDVDVKSYTNSTRRLACSIVAFGQGSRAAVEAALASGRYGTPQLYIDFCAADETPLSLRVADGDGAVEVRVGSSRLRGAAADSGVAGAPSRDTSLSLGAAPPPMAIKQRGEPAKIVQMADQCTMVLERASGGILIVTCPTVFAGVRGAQVSGLFGGRADDVLRGIARMHSFRTQDPCVCQRPRQREPACATYGVRIAGVRRHQR